MRIIAFEEFRFVSYIKQKSYDNPASASDTQFLSQVLLSWSNSPDVRPYDKTLKANHKGE